jgi:hypothetical protein
MTQSNASVSLEIGKQYRLYSFINQSDSIHFEYSICATYAGSYVVHENKSHRFIHVVHEKDYVDFVGVFSQKAASGAMSMYNELDQKTTVFYTDVFDHKLKVTSSGGGSRASHRDVYIEPV